MLIKRPLQKNWSLFFSIILVTFSNCSKNSAPAYYAYEVKQAPIVDGIIDEIWNKAKIDTIKGSIIGDENKKDDNDFTVRFRCLWDYSNLYFLFEITDDVKLYSPGINWYENDLVQLFFSHSLTKLKRAETKNGDVLQYTFIYSIDSFLLGNKYQTKSKIFFKETDTKKGYLVEIKFPWPEIDIKPGKGLHIPLNCEASDLDKPETPEGMLNKRETIIGWAPNTADRSWVQTKLYGDLILN